VFLEELYDILEKAHKETGHGGRDRMIKHLNNGYANISRDCNKILYKECSLRNFYNYTIKFPTEEKYIQRDFLT
jgi:uncharacterized protein (UPF0332 family)